MRTLNPCGHWHNRTQLLSRIGIEEDHTTSSVITYTQGHPDYLGVFTLVELVNTIIVYGKWRWK